MHEGFLPTFAITEYASAHALDDKIDVILPPEPGLDS
jgi:hypothetical protein